MTSRIPTAPTVGIVTDEISPDLSTCRRFLEELGISTVELRCVGEGRIPTLSGDDRATLTRWVESGDLRISALSPGIFKGTLPDETQWARELEDTLPRTIDLARELSCERIICFGFEKSDGDEESRVVETIRAATVTCAAAGLTLLLENEPGFHATTAADLARITASVDHPSLHVNWDPTNSNAYAPEDLDQALHLLGPELHNVHVKNGKLHPGELHAECCSLLEGDLPWETHLRQLRRHRYPGPFIVETHFLPGWEASTRVVSELRALLDATYGDGAP